MAHIEPWAKVLKHEFENMIVLCSTCHTRYDVVKDIPKKSILQFKYNLGLLSHRYTQVENQVLRYFGRIAANGLRPGDYRYAIHPGMTILFTNLFEDGLFVTQRAHDNEVIIQGVTVNLYLTPTDSGSDFITRMVEAESLED